MPTRRGLTLMAVVAVITGGGGPAASVRTPCARAEALLKAGYASEAEQAYKRLLGIQPCATVKRVREARTMVANETQSSGLGSPSQLQLARRLQNAGFDEDARKAVKQFVENSTARVPAELRGPNQRTGWWRRQLGKLGPLLRTVAEAGVVVLGAAVIVLLAITLTRSLLLRLYPSVRLEAFVGSDNDALSPILTAALGAALEEMREDGAGHQLNWVSGSEPKFNLPTAVSEALPQANLISGLVQMIDQLLYRRMYVVTGTVLPVDTHSGAGLTIAVATRRGRTIDQVTIWESELMLKELGESETEIVRYERLIRPAAVWLGYRKRLGFKPKGLPPLNTHDWLSYALFGLGEHVHRDPRTRRTLYERALDRDAGNLGAHFNLGALLLVRPEYEVPGHDGAPSDGRRETWVERRQLADHHLRVVAGLTSSARDPLWYRARFLQGILHIYRREGARAEQCLAGIRKEMGVFSRVSQLEALLDAMRIPLIVLEATAALVRSEKPVAAPKLGGVWLTATAHYNLAAFWSRRSALESGDEQGESRKQAIVALREAIQRSNTAVEQARVDEAFDPIRDTDAFEALLDASSTVDESAGPVSRYAITLDPGNELLKLLSSV